MSGKALQDIDKRARDTRNRIGSAIIVLAVRQPIDTITIGQLAREAGISRSTFYAHFTSLNDYLVRSYAWVLDYGAQRSAALPGGQDKVLAVEAILFHFAAARAYVAATLASRHRPAMMAAGEEQMRLRAAVNLERLRPDLSETRRLAAATFIAGGFMGLLRAWTNNGMQETPDEIRQRFDTMSRALIDHLAD